MDITLTTAQLAALTAPGGSLTLIGPNAAVVTPPPVVSPPVTPPVSPPSTSTAPKLLTVFAQNGQTPNFPQDYSYEANDTHAYTVVGGNGNAACIKVTVTGDWGAFQPSSNNGASLDCSAAKSVTVDVDAAKGTAFSMQFLMAGDLPIRNSDGSLRSVAFTKTKDGWETFSFVKIALMTDATEGDVSGKIYKGAVQLQTGAAGVFYVDNWGTV